ncbi:MAG: hypothetical protein E7666_04220 [Ruminococcaceae bacterium]|nr:hypothetical protein [Oscillospiraceae bacterium]
MKKLFCIVLCLLTLCACGCTQKPAQYYAYGGDQVYDSTSYLNCYPAYHFPSIFDKYIDENAEKTKTVEINGMEITGEYERSYDLIHHSYRTYETEKWGFFRVTEDGVVRSFYSYCEECEGLNSADNKVLTYISQAEQFLKATFGVDVSDYRITIVSDDLRPSGSVIIYFTKCINEIETSDSVWVQYCCHGKLIAYSAEDDFGLFTDDMDDVFDDELVETAIKKQVETAFAEGIEAGVEWRYIRYTDLGNDPKYILTENDTVCLSICLQLFWSYERDDGRIEEGSTPYHLYIFKDPLPEDRLLYSVEN